MFSGSTTGAGNTQDDYIECKFDKEATFLLDVTAISGNLDIEIQTYNWLTAKWHKLAEFTTKTTTGTDEGFVEYGIGERLAVKYDGTATFSVDVTLK
jgi:hypothetical protein